MKTILALLIAMLGFGATLAWSAEPAATPNAVSRPAPKDAKPAPSPKNAQTPRAPAVPAFDGRLLQGPAVLCACGWGRPRA